MGVGLVEADVAVVTDAQQLQIHAAQIADDAVIVAALHRSVQLQAIGHVGVSGIDIDVIEEIGAHEVDVALVVGRAQTNILVKIHGANLGEVQIALFIPLDQLLISADGRASGSQAQHAVGLQDDLSGNNIGRFAACVIIILCTDNSHNKEPLSYLYDIHILTFGAFFV